jgi:hypothetical protein
MHKDATNQLYAWWKNYRASKRDEERLSINQKLISFHKMDFRHV